MSEHDETYLKLLHCVLKHGEVRKDRTGVGARSLFGQQMRFALGGGFPLLTTKKLFVKGIVAELIWFLKGDSNIKFLHDHNVHIWDEWADENGELGPVYGRQWRSWQAPNGQVIDQIANLIKGLKENPFSRRHIVTAWNPAEVDDMALPPCHCLFQFYVSNSGKLSCHLYQRSADIFLGVPFNIASYALLTHMIAREAGLKPGKFVYSFGDLHLYENHIEQAEEQLTREPRKAPQLWLNPDKSLFTYEPEDVAFMGYDPHPAIKAPIAV